MDASERFGDVVARESVPLDEAALLIAAHAYPALDVARYLHRLDELAVKLRAPTRGELARVLFRDAGLRGNADDYYAPDNSFLNRVLDTGLGIPITLAVVMMEVGRRAGLTLTGVNAPSHFLVRDVADGALLDPFASGAEVMVEDAPTAPTVVILGRMLNNLRTVYASRGEFDHLIWVLRLRTLLPGAGPEAAHELTRAVARLN